MGRINFLLPILILIFCTLFAFSQESEDSDTNNISLRPGMEIRKVGNLNVVVPEGGRIYEDEHRRLFIESAEEYAARRFKETEERFERIEKEQQELKNKLERLEKIIEEMKRE